MTDVASTTAGYFPRPDYLIETLKDVQGYQKQDMGPEAEEKVEDVFHEGRRDVIGIQEEAGIDLVTEGQLSWDDIIAFPATRIDGIEMGGIKRFYDNNRFYRQPKVVDELEHSGEITAGQYDDALGIASNDVKPVMAGAYSLARLSKNECYGSDDEYRGAFADVVNEELRALADAGADTIQLDEPSLTGVNDEGVDVDEGIETVERSLEGVDADVVVTTYFGEITDAYPRLLDIADGVGIDLVSGEENLGAVEEYGADGALAVGCMNARNTRLEPVDELVGTVEEVLDRAEPETTYVSPSCGLDFLPWTVMEEKVQRLGEAVEEVSA
jgi:5-methyltetrahydropteroyltriglutamate--homocysteine methyltransferase